MSLLSEYVQKEFLKSLEAEFIAHAPDLQKVIINEIQVFAADLTTWIESKMDSQPKPKE